MGKTVIIAEKPSVAQDIVRALTPTSGKFEKGSDHFENDQYVVTSAVGHLVEIKAPEAYDVKRGKWSFANLPVVPPHFDLAPIDKAKSRLSAVVKQVKRKDVSALINACDAGREGELIFRLIVQYAFGDKPNPKPIQRLWLQSMTPQAIRDGFDKLRSDAQMQGLADAARSRSEADWLVGINGTRAMTAFNSRDGGFFLTTVGRVQTPTLSIVVEREEKIRKHVSRDYWEVRADFDAQAGSTRASGSTRSGRRTRRRRTARRPAVDRGRRRRDPRRGAGPGRHRHRGGQAQQPEQPRPVRPDHAAARGQRPLRLQRQDHAVDRAGAVREAQGADLPADRLAPPARRLRGGGEEHLRDDCLGRPARAAARPGPRAQGPEGRLRQAHQARVRQHQGVDHFAIIPTLQAPRSLNEIEAKLYDLVVKRFLAVFYPPAEYMVTTRISKVELPAATHHFQTNGKVLVNPGWLAVYGKEAQDEDANLVPVQQGEQVRVESVDVKALQTRPPARYNEGTLLSAMEGAGKLIDDDELREAMAEKGLGTPATRAQVIEGLILEKYMLREGRDLIPTAKAFQLMTLLRGLAIEDLTKPELTGNWEYQLAEMEHGRLKRDDFMGEIAKMAERIVRKAKEYDRDTIPGDYATLATRCPNCGGVVKENYRRFACTGATGSDEGCGFSITKIPAGRAFEVAEADAFLRDKKIGPLEGFRSKAGWPFTAELKLVRDDEIANWKLEFDFGDAAKGAEGDGEPVDFSAQTSLGACPKCKGHVYDHGTSYVCEHAVGAPVTCDFKSGKIILQQPVPPEEMSRLLATGKTQLLENFVSNKTRRKFKAFLTYDKKEGKVVFEFEPRAPKVPAAKKAAAKKATA
jgi:DNA topoisomerase-3